MRAFKTVFMRGGTSKGCMFHKEDLPEKTGRVGQHFPSGNGQSGSEAD